MWALPLTWYYSKPAVRVRLCQIQAQVSGTCQSTPQHCPGPATTVRAHHQRSCFDSPPHPLQTLSFYEQNKSVQPVSRSGDKFTFMWSLKFICGIKKRWTHEYNLSQGGIYYNDLRISYSVVAPLSFTSWLQMFFYYLNSSISSQQAFHMVPYCSNRSTPRCHASSLLL